MGVYLKLMIELDKIQTHYSDMTVEERHAYKRIQSDAKNSKINRRPFKPKNDDKCTDVH